MQFIHRLSMSHPMSLSVVLFIIAILISQLGAILLAGVLPMFDAGTYSILTRYGCAALMILLILKLGGLSHSGINTPIRYWHKHWWLVTSPMLIIVLLNLSRAHWQDISISLFQIPQWFFTHFATGLFEEIMMRALVFFILVRAWSHKENVLIKAAIAQGLLFGALHLLNLLNGMSMVVIVQTLYATLIGISFAGVVAITRTVWPAVICHTMINAAGSLNRTFIPNYVEEATSLGMYRMFTIIIFVTTTLPLLYMLHRHSKKSRFSAS